MVDGNYTEVPGLGAAVNLFISKNGGLMNPSAAPIAEISHGWYTALLPAAECDTIGPVSIYMTGTGCIQQNAEYVVQQRNAGCINFTYTLTDITTGLPVPNANIWITSDLAGLNVLWTGETNAVGIALDSNSDLPCLNGLPPTTYYFWALKSGLVANAFPDLEICS
jgi:hypothetical protein